VFWPVCKQNDRVPRVPRVHRMGSSRTEIAKSYRWNQLTHKTFKQPCDTKQCASTPLLYVHCGLATRLPYIRRRLVEVTLGEVRLTPVIEATSLFSIDHTDRSWWWPSIMATPYLDQRKVATVDWNLQETDNLVFTRAVHVARRPMQPQAYDHTTFEEWIC
jgi:hypothetical protein